jgi:hypothetical protein
VKDGFLNNLYHWKTLGGRLRRGGRQSPLKNKEITKRLPFPLLGLNLYYFFELSVVVCLPSFPTAGRLPVAFRSLWAAKV